MTEKTFPTGPVSRRDILKVGAYGICALCVAGITGCIPLNDNEEAPPVDDPSEVARKGLLGDRRSPWFSKLDNDLVRCELCPKRCELAEGERGPCRVRENRDGEGYTLVYGNPALVREDPVERKPYFHVLPGTRALSISTAGCNLACKFCEVWDMALVSPEEVHAYEMPPDAVVEHAGASKVRSISYAFGEPVIFYEYMNDVADRAREAGMLNLMHTAGYIRPEPLEEIAEKLDAVNFDLKGFDDRFYREYVGCELEPVLETLKKLHRSGVHLEITNIVIPTLNDDMEMIGDMCRWIVDELGEDVPLHFARFYPLYKLSALTRTPASTLEEARNKAFETGLKYVYVARVTGHEGENTFCPDCGEMIIERKGFVIEEIKMDKGKCAFCGVSIPGLWE